MNFAQFCCVLLLLCALTLAQGNDGVSETPSCYANMCERLDKFDALQSQIQELRNKVETVTTPVIFSAATGGSDTAIGPYNTGTTLIFRKVITNVGSAYNSATGVFAAPHNGIYHFSFFFHAGGEHPVQLQLFKNNDVIVEIYDRKSSSDKADNGGNAAFVQLQQGDQVYVRMRENTHVWGNDWATTFSGILVSQM